MRCCGGRYNDLSGGFAGLSLTHTGISPPALSSRLQLICPARVEFSASAVLPDGDSMSEGGLSALRFLLGLSGCILVIWSSLRAAKRRTTRWDSNSTIWFIMTISNFGRPQIEMWKRYGGYDEDPAKIIIKCQNCMPVRDDPVRARKHGSCHGIQGFDVLRTGGRCGSAPIGAL
jgi:hypothetical protein